MSSPDPSSILATVRGRPPVRRVRNGGGSVVGRFPSRKTGRPVQYESMLEFGYVVWREWDPAVQEFYDQPLEIPLGPSASSPSRRAVHVPDFLVVWPDRIVLDEVKPLARLQDHPRLQDRCTQARAWAEAQGLQYAIVTEEELPAPPVLTNLVFLATFRMPPVALSQLGPPLLDRVAQEPGVTVWDLAERLPGTDPRTILPCVWHLVFTHQLAVDLSKEQLRAGSERRARLYPAEWRG